MIKKQINNVFTMNHKLEDGKKKTGDNHPPRNKIEVMPESQSMLLYSAKKNMANVMDENSVL